MKPAAVVFGWAGFNAVLTAIMFLYGESLEFIGIYAAAVLLTVAIGAAVLLAHRRPAGSRRMPAASRSAGLLGLAAILFGLGFLYTHWLSYLALFPLLLAAVTFRRERLPEGTMPVATEVPSTPVIPQPREDAHPVLNAVARTASAVTVVARVYSALRHPGRRRS